MQFEIAYTFSVVKAADFDTPRTGIKKTNFWETSIIYPTDTVRVVRHKKNGVYSDISSTVSRFSSLLSVG